MKCQRVVSKKQKKIKTMNSKMTNKLITINKGFSFFRTEPKKQKVSKQLEQEQNQRNGDHMEGYQWGGRRGEWREKVQGIRSVNGRHKIDGGEVKNSIGNGGAKELTCTTQGHDLRRWGMLVGGGRVLG